MFLKFLPTRIFNFFLPAAHLAHLVLPDKQARPFAKPKELIFSNARTDNRKLMLTFDQFCQNIYCLMNSFGDIIRKAREEKGLFLRQVAAEMEIDQAIISKFERGDRKPTKEQVLKFAKFYKLDKEELLVAWLSDKVAYDLQGENLADKVLKAAEHKIKYKKK